MEFEEDRWVYLAQFTLSRSKFTVEDERRGFDGKDCWTITEQLPASVELPVNLEADPKADS